MRAFSSIAPMLACLAMHSIVPELARAQVDEPTTVAASPIEGEADGGEPVAPTAAPSTGAIDERVQALLADAVAEYDAARYPEALALFRRAHELSPTARTLRGIGMAAFESGQYVVALRALRASLDEPARPLTEEQRTHVERLIERTQVFVATLVLELTPADAPFLVDSSPPTRELDGTLLLDAGHHVISVTGAGGHEQTLEFDLVGGTERTVVIRADAEVNESSGPLLAGGLTLVVSGALTALAAGATGVVALVLRDQLARACDGFVCPEDQRGTRALAADLALVTDVLGPIGGGLLATGLVLILVSATTTTPPPVSLACGPDGCTVWSSGRF